MRLAGLMALLLAVVLPATQPTRVKIARGSLTTMESSFDVRLTKLSQDDPFDLLGNTRGVYLEGYGAVFTTELNLIVTPSITPFRPSISKADADKVHQRKLQKLPVLKRAMREMLIASAAALDKLPADEQLVLAVTLFYYSWEDRAGLPSQIVLQAPKNALLQGAGRVPDAAFRIEEL